MFVCCVHKSDFLHNLCIVIFSCCARKSDFRHSLCILILSCCAHKFDFRHKKGILIFACCAHKYDLHHNPCIVILVFHVYTWFVALTFCRCPNTLHNTLLIVYFFWFLKHSSNKKCLHFVHFFFSVFKNHQVLEKYHLAIKNKNG